jgi:hypothetical protein
MKVLLVNRADVLRMLPVDACVPLMREVLRAL